MNAPLTPFPAPIGPYRPAVRAGHLLFCSGQIPLDSATGQLVSGDIAAQTARALENLKALLGASNLTLAEVVKTTVFLTDMADFAAMNAVYARFFSHDCPARSTVQVAALPKGARLEIEAVAAFPTS